MSDELDDYLRTFLTPATEPVATGFKRAGQVAIRGASLGLLGTKRPAEGIGEHIIETAASIPAVVGVSALTTPLVGVGARVLPALRIPAVARIASGALAGAPVGATQALGAGENPLLGAVSGAGTFAAIESGLVGAGKVRQLLRAPKVVSDAPLTTKQLSAPPSLTDVPVGVVPPTIRVPRIEPPDTIIPELPIAPRRGQMEFPLQEELPFAGPTRPNVQLRTIPAYDDVARSVAEKSARPEGWDAGLEEITAPYLPISPITGRSPFKAFVDPDTGIITYASRDDMTAALVERSRISQAVQKDLPFGVEQLTFLEGAEGRGLLKKLDVVGAREPTLTSNIEKMTEDGAKRLIEEAPPAKVASLISIESSPRAVELTRLLEKAGVSLKEYDDFIANTVGIKGNREMALRWLQERCK